MRFRTRICLRGSSGRPAQNPCIALLDTTSTSRATGSPTCLPSTPPKSRAPTATCSCRIPISTPGVQQTRRRNPRSASASTGAFILWRQLLAFPDIPDDERQRIAANRDEAVPTMLEATSGYPDMLVCNSIAAPAGVHAHHRRASDAEVTVSLIAGPDLVDTQQALNSFLNCCNDVSHVGRFLLIDAGLSAADREILQALYEFLEFAHLGPNDAEGIQLAQVREHIRGRFWLHLDQNWRFFAPENLITRLSAVLDAEADVFQVAINLADAITLTRASAPEHGSPNARRRPLCPA